MCAPAVSTYLHCCQGYKDGNTVRAYELPRSQVAKITRHYYTLTRLPLGAPVSNTRNSSEGTSSPITLHGGLRRSVVIISYIRKADLTKSTRVSVCGSIGRWDIVNARGNAEQTSSQVVCHLSLSLPLLLYLERTTCFCSGCGILLHNLSPAAKLCLSDMSRCDRSDVTVNFITGLFSTE